MDDILVSLDKGVLALRFNRPAKKNALTRDMYATLANALNAAADDEAVRVAVISGEGGDFTAGNDILDFAKGMSEGGDGAIEAMPVFRFLKALTYFPKPLIAAVQGQAVGVGVTLLLHCDLVVASDDVRLRLPFLHLGLVPEAGSTLLLPQRIGHARAFAWLTQGQAVTAAQAHDWGLINTVVAREALVRTADEMARGLLALSPEALGHTKAFLRDPNQVWQVVQAEGEVFRRLLTRPHALAAFSAFLNRG